MEDILDKGSEEIEKIQNLINEVSETNEKEFLVDLRYKINDTSSDVKDAEKSIEALEKQIKELSKENDSLTEQIEKITDKNKDIEKEILENPLEKVKWLDEQIDDKKRDQKQAELKFDSLHDEIERVKQEIQRISDKNGGNADFINKLSITGALSHIIESFSKKAVENFSKLLEEEINSLLKDNEKLNVFTVERKISDTGEVEFNFKERGSQNTYFSGGQTQLKGIIQIAAFTRVMDRVSKDKLPIPFVVMDHPISDVDKERVKKIAEQMGGLFRNSQVLLFVANDKFSVFDTIAKESIANRLLVTKDAKSNESTVEEVR